MENKNYFQHDYRSRLDEKLLKVRMKHNMQGVGIYWCLVEMLHETNGTIKTDLETIAYDLRADINVVKDVIDICFIYANNEVKSERVIKNLEYRKEKQKQKSEKGREAANKRWKTHTQPMGDPYQTHTQPIPNLYKNDGSSMGEDAKEKEKEKEKEKDKDKEYKPLTNSSNSIAVKGEKTFAEIYYNNPNISVSEYLKN